MYVVQQGMTDILKLFKDKNQVVFLLNVKPSIRRIWSMVMAKNKVNAVFCKNETELDIELQSKCIQIPKYLNVITKFVHFIHFTLQIIKKQ